MINFMQNHAWKQCNVYYSNSNHLYTYKWCVEHRTTWTTHHLKATGEGYSYKPINPPFKHAYVTLTWPELVTGEVVSHKTCFFHMKFMKMYVCQTSVFCTHLVEWTVPISSVARTAVRTGGYMRVFGSSNPGNQIISSRSNSTYLTFVLFCDQRESQLCTSLHLYEILLVHGICSNKFANVQTDKTPQIPMWQAQILFGYL